MSNALQPAAARTRVWDTLKDVPTLARAMGEFARDMQQAVSALARTKVVRFEAVYTEPFTLDVPNNPEGIYCLRVRDRDDQTTPVLSGCAVHWVWFNGVAQINSIDGLTPGATTYLFTFLVVN